MGVDEILGQLKEEEEDKIEGLGIDEILGLDY